MGVNSKGIEIRREDCPGVLQSWVPLSEAAFGEIAAFSNFQRGVMPLFVFDGDSFTPIGTCFCIEQTGLCLTARHVVETFFKRRAEGVSNNEKIYAMYAVNGESGKLNGGALLVNRIEINWNLDIAIINLNCFTDQDRFPFVVATLDLRVPKIGEIVTGYGYSNMTSKGYIKNNKIISNITQEISHSSGSVQEVFIPMRDRCFANFPCFQTSSRFDAGMSGGPVCSERGGVIGVVCSSIAPLDDGAEHTSCVSLVAPAALSHVSATFFNGVSGTCYLWDMVRAGYVMADVEGIKYRRTREYLEMDMGEHIIRNPVAKNMIEVPADPKLWKQA